MFVNSLYSEFIYKSRYARYLTKENRRENWPETIKRYMDFMVEFLKENNDYDVPLNLRKELEDSILAHNVMPSMRLLMTAGEAAKKNNIAAYNCLSGETLVITKEYGTVSISSLEGKKVHIIDGDGNWTLSECKCYGEDNLYEISLTTPGIASDYIIRSTKNHDWYLTNKTKIQTSELKIGDDLLNGIVPNRIKIEENSLEYKKGIIHGIIYGDGTASYKGRGSSSKLTSSEKLFNGFLIRLCGSSIELKSYFDEMDYSVSYPKSYNGEPVYYIPNPTIDLKSLPNEEYFTIDYLVGFIRGWMAADGTVTIGGQVSLACNNEGKEWFFKNGPKCGFYIRNCRKYLEETNYGKRLKSLYCLDLDRRWLFDEDIILNYKKEKFKKIKKGWSGKIKSIKNLNVKEKVYCFDVPTTHSFMLYKNIMTGNCCFLPLDDFKSFDEMMAILMSGTGVGFSVENFFTKNLVELPDELYESNTIIVFEDSRLGWSKGYREFIYLLLSGQIPKYDISKLRPAGTRLKTMGGRSSGPLPLVDLLEFTIALFKKARGRKLTTLEAHDLACKIADIVVVGGVRRSALISLSDLSDNKMREAKTGQWWTTNPHRRLANNSAVYNEKPDIGTFMKEWLSLYESKSGERGIFARNAIRTVIDNSNSFRKTINSPFELRSREYQDDFGTNPCLHPDSLIETINGRVKIKDIVNPTMVYSMGKDGKLCIKNSSASWISKKNTNTIKITIDSGKELICTPDHKIFIENKGWIEAQSIKINDKVIHLVRNRRGAAYSGVKLSSQDKRDFTMEHRLVYEAYYGKIPDGYDIHHIDGNTYNNDVNNLECLSHEDHAKLTALEQPNNHMITGYFDDGCYGFISPSNSRHGSKIIIPMPEELKSNLHQYAYVKKIEDGPITDVYDLTVEDTHNFIADFIVVHNCSEIILRPYQFCNLTSVQIYADDTFETINNKIRLATILGTFQSCLTNFKYINKRYKKNCEEERLLGVSLNGIFDNTLTNGFSYLKGGLGSQLRDNLQDWKKTAIVTNAELAKEIGIPSSVAITCVKPEGTSSALNGVSSGIHPAHSPYYIRYARNDLKDPLTAFMIDTGFPYEKDAYDPNNVVAFKFPIKPSESAVFKHNITAIEHLNLWKIYQQYWCEHKPSVSISVKENEWLDVGAWCYENFEWLSGVAFFPADESTTIYKQAPFTTCDEKEYNRVLAMVPENVDWTKLSDYELEDSTKNLMDLACSSGNCDVI
jgi:ribonucleotide reductase alpha subunit